MAITSLDDFKRYCLRRLGAPVLSIDVTDDQIQDRYEDAVSKYQNHHFDGTIHTFLKHQITQEDFDNKYITTPSNILGVTRMVPYNIGGTSSSDGAMFSVTYQYLLNDMHHLWTTGSISYFEHTMQHLTMMDQLLNGKPTYRFNKVQNRIYVDVLWEKRMMPGNWVLFEVLQTVDPEEYVEVFDDPWFKNYATALIKRQWGENLKKFSGIQMMGGTTLNGQQIWNEAVEEVNQLEQELMERWSEPAEAFFVG